MGTNSSKYPPPDRIIMIGLDSAGKTSLLHKLKCGDVTPVIPSIGLNMQSLSLNKQTNLVSWDLGGRSPLRALWRYYLREMPVQGIVFVVDSADGRRIEEAAIELEVFMSEHELLGNSPLLLLANKKDLPNAMPLAELADAMKLPQLQRQRPCAAFAVCAVTFEGAPEAFEWLAGQIKRSGGGIGSEKEVAEAGADSSGSGNKLQQLAESLLPKALRKHLFA